MADGADTAQAAQIEARLSKIGIEVLAPRSTSPADIDDTRIGERNTVDQRSANTARTTRDEDESRIHRAMVACNTRWTRLPVHWSGGRDTLWRWGPSAGFCWAEF